MSCSQATSHSFPRCAGWDRRKLAHAYLFTEPLERLLRDGIADGSLRNVDPVETATVLFNQVGWTYVHLRTGHGWNAQRAQTATVDPVFNGIIAR
ncbi:MAG: hypothetical protein ACR2JH_05590 [Solirubrobacteraceae bacterium]